MQATRTLARPARKPQAKPRPPVLVLLRAALWGVLASLGLVVLYAVALRQNWLGTDTMGAATTAIKVLGAAFAGSWPAGPRAAGIGFGGCWAASCTAFWLFCSFPCCPRPLSFPWPFYRMWLWRRQPACLGCWCGKCLNNPCKAIAVMYNVIEVCWICWRIFL